MQAQLSKRGTKTPVSRTSSQEVRGQLDPSRSSGVEGHAALKATVSESSIETRQLIRQATLGDGNVTTEVHVKFARKPLSLIKYGYDTLGVDMYMHMSVYR